MAAAAPVAHGLVISTGMTRKGDPSGGVGAVPGRLPSGGMSTALSIGAALLGLVGIVIVFVVALLAQAASIYVVAKQASGEVVGAGPALTFAAGRALPLLGWSILAGILVIIGFVLLVLPGLY